MQEVDSPEKNRLPLPSIRFDIEFYPEDRNAQAIEVLPITLAPASRTHQLGTGNMSISNAHTAGIPKD